ncbi:MAG: hypothetical protein H0A76_06695 [Candidatus Thiodubiliella endoseptemdiera]|uniref:Uncharacterized protein n=1 Tax=Candidatus Thiodubiliella endoseptemdiera TaxID=2738886 RepID=A0A853F4V1_9GAMM|nr:hypothetical protein [Candidatus Thiodubiliella endoseptemdiera]
MPLPNKSKPTSKRLTPGFSTYAPPLKSAKKPPSPNKTTPPSSSTKTNPAPPTPHPTPTLKLEHIEHLIARITAHHAASHDQGTRPSLPDRIDIIDWQWVINNIREPIDTLIYSNHKTTKTATLKLTFDPNQTGQFCHIISRYGITNGEVGTFSPSLSFAIT